jgi:hypothetical protein
VACLLDVLGTLPREAPTCQAYRQCNEQCETGCHTLPCCTGLHAGHIAVRDPATGC